MTLKELRKEDYYEAISHFSEVSFTQTIEMANLLKKRGFDIVYLGFDVDGGIEVAGILYTKAMAGVF